MKLFPIVAIMWAHAFTGEIISKKYKQMLEEIKI